MKVTFFFRVLAALIFGASTTHAASPEKKRDPSREWLDNRWEIRYVLFMDAQKYMRRSIQFAKKRNAFDGKQSEPYVYLNAKELFTCLVSCDHIPRRSMALFRAKAVLDELIGGLPPRSSHRLQHIA